MFTLVVKSYFNDLNRAVRLVKSIREYNRDHIPLYFIVPCEDLTSFQDKLGTEDINFLVDTDILELTMSFLNQKRYLFHLLSCNRW